jgi:hypothetical protein
MFLLMLITMRVLLVMCYYFKDLPVTLSVKG